uniref:Uncharacterized protein n=1 Tax=Knipowitschia caucasica TaxID=637954 RepID=A0AAV2KCS7_KNICA
MRPVLSAGDSCFAVSRTICGRSRSAGLGTVPGPELGAPPLPGPLADGPADFTAFRCKRDGPTDAPRHLEQRAAKKMERRGARRKRANQVWTRSKPVLSAGDSCFACPRTICGRSRSAGLGTVPGPELGAPPLPRAPARWPRRLTAFRCKRDGPTDAPANIWRQRAAKKMERRGA